MFGNGERCPGGGGGASSPSPPSRPPARATAARSALLPILLGPAPLKVVMVSKALVVGAYQRKAEEIAAHTDVELTVVVPPAWRLEGRDQVLERAYLDGYRLRVEPIRFNGSFHLFHFPTLGRVLRAERPDVVHVDEEPYNLAPSLAFRASLRVGAAPLFFPWQNLLRRYPPPFRWLE